MIKNREKLIEEFLKNNSIEVLPTIKDQLKPTVSQMKVKITDIVSLGEAMDVYGEKQTRVVKKKEIVVSDINKALIPEHLHKILDMYSKNPKEEVDEADCD